MVHLIKTRHVLRLQQAHGQGILDTLVIMIAQRLPDAAGDCSTGGKPHVHMYHTPRIQERR
jgi:hypothetical protein